MNPPANPPERLLKHFSLLYVEDDDNIREQLEQFLRRRVKEFFVAVDGAKGLEAYFEHKPDMIVSDILMPEMTGLEMAEKIKADNPEVPIIVTTAFNETDYFLKAIQIGIDNYVLKPVDTEMLQRALDKSARVLFQRRELATRKAEMEKMLDELQQYYYAAERENQMVAELMDRTRREENLADPLLKSWISPATTFSGDLVAAQRAPNDDLFVILADATGHGLAAAMNLLPLSRTFYRMVDRGFGIPAMLQEMNLIIREQSSADRFVAVTLVRVDQRNRIYEVWNGGNPPVVCLDGEGQTHRLFKSTNLALGILNSSEMDLHTDVVHWAKHLQLLMFSDGFVEAENPDGVGIGLEGLLAAIGGEAMEKRFTMAVESVQQHLAGKPAHDDLSLIVIDCPA